MTKSRGESRSLESAANPELKNQSNGGEGGDKRESQQNAAGILSSAGTANHRDRN